METNNRNYKNPTVIAWEQLRQLLTQFADRMQNFDAMAQKQGRDIGVDEVFNEIQNIRKQLDEIQKGLNLQNNTINTERVVDKSQPETPFSITNNNRNDESKNMNKKLIRLTESDLHKIVKESVNRIINEIGNTDKGQDALGQVRGRADKRSKLLGGAIGNKYRKISRDAQDKAYSQGKKHGFDIYDPNGAYDKGISKGYEKALKESDNWEDDESTIDYWRQTEDNYLMQEKLPRGWEKHKCDDVFGGFIYTDGDYNEYYKDQYGRFQPLDNEF